MFRLPFVEPRRPAPSERTGVGFAPVGGEPIGAFPAAHVAKRRALSFQLFVDGRAFGSSRRRHRSGGVVALVHEAEGLSSSSAPVVRVRLIRKEAVDVYAGDVDIRLSVEHPVRHHATDSTAGENADGVESGSDEVVFELG